MLREAQDNMESVHEVIIKRTLADINLIGIQIRYLSIDIYNLHIPTEFCFFSVRYHYPLFLLSVTVHLTRDMQ